MSSPFLFFHIVLPNSFLPLQRQSLPAEVDSLIQGVKTLFCSYRQNRQQKLLCSSAKGDPNMDGAVTLRGSETWWSLIKLVKGAMLLSTQRELTKKWMNWDNETLLLQQQPKNPQNKNSKFHIFWSTLRKHQKNHHVCFPCEWALYTVYWEEEMLPRS